MILGISPLPIYMQGSYIDEKIGENQLIRKNSTKSESEETNLNECKAQDYTPEQTTPASSSKTSNHHNFQKHTVTALRDLIKES